MDGDGDLDLAVGNWGTPNRLYRNDNGILTASAVWFSVEHDYTNSVAWGDADGDGDLDLAVGNENGPSRLYRNDNGVLTAVAVWSSVEADSTKSVAWGDVDGDGDLDLATGGYDPNQGRYANIRLYKTQTPAHPLHASATTAVNLNVYRNLAPANFYAVPGIRSGPSPPATPSLTLRLAQPGECGASSRRMGGRWLPAVAGSGTITHDIPSGIEQVYRWDAGASGSLGQSDNVVFRLEALLRRPLPSQRPYVSAHTYPFRVRGHAGWWSTRPARFRALLVYRLPATKAPAASYWGDSDTPFRTSTLGYLRRGQIGPSDQLVALWPVTQTEKFTLYHTSARPTETGLDAFTVSQSGVQTLTVPADNPLILFNLAVSLNGTPAPTTLS
ncbi:MAG: FG-GAP-like repeat-containing protein [Anaerolineae bacterium]